MKKTKLFAAVALALGMATTAHSAVFFDPDGTGGSSGPLLIGAFDWGPTSIFAQNANTAIAAFTASQGACPATSCQFNLYTHARVIGFLDSNGAALPNPAGLNSAYELTMIARFTETVTAVGTLGGNPIVQFATVPTAPGFLQMFYDNSVDAVDVSGSGFNDGRLILNGTQVGSATSQFSITNPTPVALDQAGANDYTGQLTVSGNGSSGNIPVNALTTDGTFFITPLDAFGVTFAQISLGLPYISVNPSDCFTGAAQPAIIGGPNAALGCSPAHINGLMAVNIGELPPGIVPVIGLVNATAPSATGGPDFVAQSDYNSPLQGAIPEPGSLALLGLSLGLFGFFGGGLRRRFGRG